MSRHANPVAVATVPVEIQHIANPEGGATCDLQPHEEVAWRVPPLEIESQGVARNAILAGEGEQKRIGIETGIVVQSESEAVEFVTALVVCVIELVIRLFV